jgi:hypothetical protein
MSILNFFTRFTLVYTLAMGIAGIALGLLEVESASSINTPILFAIAFWCFYSYSSKNSRVIEGAEKWKLIFSALAGDIIASALLAAPIIIADEIPLDYLLIGMAITIPLHLLVFMAVNYVAKKQIIKLLPELNEPLSVKR